MEKTLKFKTNINCGGCIRSITPKLNNTSGISEWNVDTTSPEKILTVKSDGISAEEIASIVKNAGFMAEPMT